MENNETEASEAENSVQWPRKNKRQGRKEDKIRLSKVKGEEHVNHKGKVIEERRPGTTCR